MKYFIPSVKKGIMMMYTRENDFLPLNEHLQIDAASCAINAVVVNEAKLSDKSKSYLDKFSSEMTVIMLTRFSPNA